VCVLLGEPRAGAGSRKQSQVSLAEISQVCAGLPADFDASYLCIFSKEQIGALANLSRWAFLLTFAGVGLRANFKALSKQGLKPFLVGAIGEVAIAGFMLGLVLAAQRLFGW
jgi:Conserved hypothetical protein 698